MDSGLVVVLRGSVGIGLYGAQKWQRGLFIASLAALLVSLLICGVLVTPGDTLRRWRWTARPTGELYGWAVVASIFGVALTAVSAIAAAIDAGSPFDGSRR